MVVSAKAHFKDAEAGVDMLDVSLDRASGMDALKDQVVQSAGPAMAAPSMAAEVSPMDSFFDNFAKSSSPSDGNTTKQQSNLQQQFSAVLSNNRPIWQPTVKLDNSRVATNTVQNRQEGDAKIADANQKMADMRSEIQDITKKMDQPDAKGGAENQMGGAPGGSALGGLGGGLVRDAMLSGGLTAIGMPFAAAAVGAASMAVAVTGRGTFGVANSGEFSASKTDRKGRTVDAGYARSEASPAAGSPASGPAAPQASAVWNKLANGPGFGATPRSKIDEASADLAGQSLTGIAALKLAENSPAMMAYKSQRIDGEAVHKIHEARIAKGLVADEPNLSRAQNIGVPEAMINRPMLSGLHM